MGGGVGREPLIQKTAAYDQRPPSIAGCPPPIEELMVKCWDKDINIRPSMNTVVESVTFLQQFFPGSLDPIKFLDSGRTRIIHKNSILIIKQQNLK